ARRLARAPAARAVHDREHPQLVAQIAPAARAAQPEGRQADRAPRQVGGSDLAAERAAAESRRAIAPRTADLGVAIRYDRRRRLARAAVRVPPTAALERSTRGKRRRNAVIASSSNPVRSNPSASSSAMRGYSNQLIARSSSGAKACVIRATS